MVIEIRLDDLDVGKDFKERIRSNSRRNKFMVDDNFRLYKAEPDCPRSSCEDHGKRWECYSGFYKECWKITK